MKRLLGFIVLVGGLGLGGWLAYNYLVEMQPEARGKNPVVAGLVAAGLVYQGQKWLRDA